MSESVKQSELSEPICADRHCLVVGSSPCVDVDLIAATHRDRVIMCANGSAKIAADVGSSIDILATTTYLYRDGHRNLSEVVTDNQIRGLEVRSLWIVEVPRFPYCKDRIENGNIKCERFQVISQLDKDGIVRRACGKVLDVSTGVMLVCLAVVSKANNVRHTGISLSNGHYGMPWDTIKREHLDADTEALDILGLEP